MSDVPVVHDAGDVYREPTAYWTATARALREPRKQQHLAQLRKMLEHALRQAEMPVDEQS
jgi:hypothetical protein